MKPSKTETGWQNYQGKLITLPLEQEVEQILNREKLLGHQLTVCIGTDSQVYGNTTEFATVIVFLRKNKGGFMLIKMHKSKQPFSIKERMLSEVHQSIETAYSICNLLDTYEVELEVHADINTNPNHKSNAAFVEAMGYIKSMGFQFRAKPHAFASSYCANKFVH